MATPHNTDPAHAKAVAYWAEMIERVAKQAEAQFSEELQDCVEHLLANTLPIGRQAGAELEALVYGDQA